MAKGKKNSPLWELQNRETKTGECKMCHEYRELTVDHIFPASLLLAWNINHYSWEDRDNFQLICKKCQILKFNRFDFHNPKTIPLIEKYIAIVKDLYLKN